MLGLLNSGITIQVYEVDVREDTAPMQVLAVVRAKSQDSYYEGDIKYSLSQLTPLTHKLFMMDSVAGFFLIKFSVLSNTSKYLNLPFITLSKSS